jgi:diamine N-acetyltransferase
MLEGKKVQLRPIKRDDLPNFLKWYNDPDVTQYLTIYLPVTEMAEEKWIEDHAGPITARAGSVNDIVFVIEAIELDSHKPIGTIGLHSINQKDQTAEFGIAIGEKDCWSKGNGTEAASLLIEYGFNSVNLHRITSYVLTFNERSLRMHKKVGFVEEGRRRQAVFTNGRYVDLVTFGLLKEEWTKAQ